MRVLTLFFAAMSTAPRQDLSSVPDGFTVTLFAGEPHVRQPISFCIDDRGRLWVAEGLAYPNWKPEGEDSIIILEDTDGDGRHDKRTLFYDKLNYVTGIEIGFGGVWITSPPHLLFIPDRNGDDKPDGPPVVLMDGFGREGVHNIVNGFTWGPDGWLYGGHGGTSYSEMGKPGTPREQRVRFHGGVWRYHPTRHVFEGVMEGTTNPWGVGFDDYGQGFITNCVTNHLYHVIPGAHVERRQESALSRHAYARIETIADHKHWVGKEWNKSGGGRPEQIAAGGGHAHSGAMVYLGDSFPAEYRGRVFMVNLHGRRVNVDVPERKGSGYSAKHGPDFLVSSDSRFMGLLLQYGPDGSVFMSDWADTGECHTKKPDRATGRIFKIAYKDARPAKVDLAKLSDDELVDLQLHKNDWFVTHSRRLLQERGPNPRVHAALRKILGENPDVTRKLRALWALHVTGGPAGDLFSHKEDWIRAWAVQIEAEDGDVPVEAFEQMATADPSARVRLFLASACQRLPIPQRWRIIEGLAAHAEDAEDPNLPLMIWYAAEPLAEKDARRALELASKAKVPRFREFMARRVASIGK